jgi:hypothetical protein
MDDQEPDFLEDTEVKPKKQLSEQKLQHLANIRIKALEKKKEMKAITEKVNKLKEIESLKQVKQIQKEQLAKQYDEMIANAKPKEIEVKPKEEDKPKEEIKEVKPKEEIKEVKPKVEEAKPNKKKKIIKKIVYQEASSSDSDDADEVEVVKVKKQSKNKIIPVDKPPQPPVANNSYSNLLYESSVDKLKSRMMDERARNLIMSVMPSYN